MAYWYNLSIMLGVVMLATIISTSAYGNASSSWMSSKLELRSSSISRTGIFTKENISKNERLLVYGGRVITKNEVLALPKERIPYVLQIDNDLWLTVDQSEPADFLNHSCNPNVGFKNPYTLIAMRTIQADEEITLDYGMVVTEFVGMTAFPCNCGADNCRKTVSQDSWKDTLLQKKYTGYFAPHIQGRLACD